MNSTKSPFIAEPNALRALLIALLVLAASAVAENAPTDFVMQILEPTGGKISRPKNWYYSERHRGPIYDWVISGEDTKGGVAPYTTGVRIQTFTGVKEGTGKSAKQFIQDFIAKKKKEATKVIETCEPKEQDLFTRVCLETEEGTHHILYSLFWGTNDLDIAIVLIAGTTKDLWKTYEATFNKMGEFELIDMKRFDKAAAPGTPKAFEVERLVLYQPDQVLQARLAGAVEDFANYVKKLETVCTEFFATTSKPETLHIVIAVRPNKRSRVWFVSSDRPAPDTTREPLRKKLEAVTPCEVHDGPVAFAISAKLAGGNSKDTEGSKDSKPPIPKEWEDAAKGKENVPVPDGFLDLIWPNKQ